MGGSALQADGGSVNLSLSSSVLTAPSSGAEVYLGPGDGGLISLSTNTLSGGSTPCSAATPTPSLQLWITSNTIVPLATNSRDTYGVFLEGLASGATIENNTIAYRNAWLDESSHTSHALLVQSSAGLMIDHNRIDEPGMIAAGSFVAVEFAATTNSAFKFNDVSSTGSFNPGSV